MNHRPFYHEVEEAIAEAVVILTLEAVDLRVGQVLELPTHRLNRVFVKQSDIKYMEMAMLLIHVFAMP